jgi:GTP1/Obg family GTP-binding protein
MFDMPEQVLIVEVDENQHKNYSCELARINGIVNSVGGRPVTIIRFNPDAQNNDNAAIDMRGRLATLVSEIRANMVAPSTFRVKLIHLFYDGENVRAEDITNQVCI